jgi:hypothetical protein
VVVECCRGQDCLHLDVNKDDVSVWSQRHLNNVNESVFRVCFVTDLLDVVLSKVNKKYS